MPASYCIHESYIHVTLTGVLTGQELIAAQQLLFADHRFVGTLPRFVDGRGIESMQVSSETIRRMAAQAIERGCTKLAMVAKTDVAFGLMRMYEEYTAHVAECFVTRDPDEALVFLGL